MRFLLLVSFLFSTSSFAARHGSSLPTLSIDPQQITVSGVSSGAYMAVQMQVAFYKA